MDVKVTAEMIFEDLDIPLDIPDEPFADKGWEEAIKLGTQADKVKIISCQYLE